VFAQGRCIAEQQYRAGELHGDSLSYDESGEPAARLRFQHGQLDGPAQFFLQGRLVRRAAYRGGLLEGESTDYDAAGSVVQVVTHQANRPHGPTRRYWPDGGLMEEQVYRLGRPVAPPARFDRRGQALVAAEATAGVLARIDRLLRG